LFKRDLEQVHICLGVPAFAQLHPHRYRLYLLSTILGGGMSSRLFQEIRENRGLAYSVYSYLNLCRDAGSLVVYAGTSKEEVGKVVRLLIKEFKRV
jgi:predicted Zn-dependent peptidase